MAQDPPFHTAIIGAGIAGLTLATALHERALPVKVYESARAVGAGGIGVAFNPSTLRALAHTSHAARAAYEGAVSRPGGDGGVFFDFVDGFTSSLSGNKEGRSFTLRNELGMAAVHRQKFCEALADSLPAGTIRAGAKVVRVRELEDGRVAVELEDGSAEIADAVIGCDGVASRVRRAVIGASDEGGAEAAYTGVTNARAALPLAEARAALGDADALQPTTWLGPDGHIVTVAFDAGRILSFSAFFTTPAPLGPSNKFAHEVSAAEIRARFADWSPRVKRLLELLPDKIMTWSISDTAGSHHPQTYARGSMCIAGDAAHATGPYLGSGASFCIEDAAVLGALLGDVAACVEKSGKSPKALKAAFAAFDAVRRPRAQWMVDNSRIAGELHQWRHEGVGSDWAGIEDGLRIRFEKCWGYDTESMLKDAREDLERRLGELSTRPASEGS